MKSYGNRIAAAAAAAAGAIALTSVALTPASAAPVSTKPTVSAADDTDFSSRRRYRRGGNRAAFGAMLGVIGTIAALSARDRYYYGYGPYHRPYYAPYAYRPYPYGAYAYGPYPYGAPVVRPGPWGGYLAPY